MLGVSITYKYTITQLKFSLEAEFHKGHRVIGPGADSKNLCCCFAHISDIPVCQESSLILVIITRVPIGAQNVHNKPGTQRKVDRNKIHK